MRHLYSIYLDLHFVYLEINGLPVVLDGVNRDRPQVCYLDVAAKLDQTTKRICAAALGITFNCDCWQDQAWVLPDWKLGRASFGFSNFSAYSRELTGSMFSMMDNIISSKHYGTGSVGYVSKSGGTSNELNNILCLLTNGAYVGLAIGLPCRRYLHQHCEGVQLCVLGGMQ